MPRVGFEHTIQIFERPKTVHAAGNSYGSANTMIHLVLITKPQDGIGLQAYPNLKSKQVKSFLQLHSRKLFPMVSVNSLISNLMS
jgi:hypothetical protein